jgi:hypothetical protein
LILRRHARSLAAGGATPEYETVGATPDDETVGATPDDDTVVASVERSVGDG